MLDRKVLVIGSDERSFLSVIRSLGRYGLTVDVAFNAEHAIASKSRYIAKVVQLCAYSSDPRRWIRDLIALLKEGKYELVIPCDDPALIPIYNHRTELEKFDCIKLLSAAAYETAFSKQKSYALAKSLGVPVPREVMLQSAAEGQAAITHFSYPVVIKPTSSFRPDDLSTRHIVQKAYNDVQFAQILDQQCFENPLQIQENVLGVGVGIELLVEDGIVLFAYQHRRIHEPLQGGGSSYRRSEELHQGMFNASRKMMSALSYTGVVMVEFKHDPETDRWYFIEINGRFWGSLPLALAAGADFPKYYYQLVVEGKCDFAPDYRTGVYSRNLARDMAWLLKNMKADHNDKTLSTLSLWEITSEISHLFNLKEHIDTWAWDDPGPAMAELWELAKRAGKKLFGR